MDLVMKSWLESQHAEGMKLAAASEVLRLIPGPGKPPRRYLAHFSSPTLVYDQGTVGEQCGFSVLIQFPPDYLRVPPNPVIVVALLAPQRAFHPNVNAPFMCIGKIAPGTSLCELLYQVFAIMTFNKLTPREDDALNKDACAWARSHLNRFPLTSRPLRRSVAAFEVRELTSGVPLCN